jgi:hypothetical protein
MKATLSEYSEFPQALEQLQKRFITLSIQVKLGAKSQAPAEKSLAEK